MAEGLAVPVGDDEIGSFTGMRLPTRYSFSSIGFCAVDALFEVFEVLAQAARTRVRAMADKRRIIGSLFGKKVPIVQPFGAITRLSAG
jgi:hypothetical protein